MSKPVVYTVTLVVCVLLQAAIAPAIAIGGCSPNFLLIPVLLIALHSGAGAGGVAGFLLGLFYDFSHNGTVGCMALALCVVALIAGLLGAGMDCSSPGFLSITAALGSLVCEFAYGIANSLTSPESGGLVSTMLSYALPCALYTAFFTIVALVTIRLVLADDDSSGLGGIGGGYGPGGSGSGLSFR